MRDGCIAPRQFAVQFGAALRHLGTLLEHAAQAGGHGGFLGTPGFAADDEIARGDLGGLGALAGRLQRVAPLVALRLEPGAARLQVCELRLRLALRGAGLVGRLTGERALPGHLRRFGLQAGPPCLQLLCARAGRLEPAAGIGMFAVATLDGGLQLVPGALGVALGAPHRDQAGIGLLHLLLRARQVGAQRLQPLLALDHAGMRILATTEADPALADPFPGAGDDRLAGGKRAAQAQRSGEGFPGHDARELLGHGRRPADDLRGQ